VAGPAPAPPRARRYIALLIILLAAFTTRLVVLAQLDAHPLLQPMGRLDSGVYVDLAQRVVGGDLLARTATRGEPFFVAPLYVYFLALALTLTGGSLLGAKIVQVVLGMAAVALLYAAARPWFGHRAALAAAVLLALAGPVVFHETVLLQAALDPFLMALALALVSRALDRGRVPGGLLAGAGLGLFALNRPNALVWGVALALALPIAWGARRGLRLGGALALGLALAVAPATLRNLAVSGQPVLIASHGGLNLYIGNRAEADGTYRHVPGITPDIRGQESDARSLAQKATGRRLNAREADAYFRRLAGEWVAAHPLDAARLFLRKLAYVFGATEVALNYSYAYYSQDEPTLLGWLFVGAWLLVPLGLLGLGDRLWSGPTSRDPLAPSRDGFALWALVVPVYALSVALFFVSSRYRLPLLVPLAAGAGFAIVRLAQAVVAQERRRLVAYAAALVALFALALWPHHLDDGRAEERTAMLLWLVDNGQSDEALRRLPAVEATHSDRALLLYRLGVALGENRQAAAAVPLLERAQRLAPARGEAQLALGQALFDTSRPADAVPHLQAAWEAHVRPDVSGFDLARALAASGRDAAAAEQLARVPLPPTADAESFLAAGSFALQLGRPDLALSFFNQGLERHPALGTLHEKRGLAFVLVGRRADARADLEAACRLDPTSASARLNLAVLEAQERRLERAKALLREALQIDPGYAQAQGLLAELERAR
jgi:4-amino-4-deoxy-L-arabinose transferase-like glycosyltransferase